ncbi:hypothetical protein RA086_07120 [Lactiplantibacillus sp. WILCCON 0030]|uniref:Uncharacterized protein n=1 Tax=Lactiplantibacillus brownii TaxID=3069269 RepID=A0ABU1A8V9_9LACO|nr:hypothetical protein [Lactiplantibacillus brownii]MDQ7937397.1 hypothetical protein [Lactiplantibacillus brownii]
MFAEQHPKISMLFLHEKKSHRELTLTIIGLVLIVGGAIITTIF